ncbi:hypothetical protein K490DRAFT_49363 [Saccharata proteae CBS 121410]|uniref:Proteasome assembly chaperone 3 n=1 Tax=Saccharata proteae CBS 121410 TaxID=1314787 RepID=A0A9P4LU04_9PEZI|nr:hypothetical protein K490DRAFT_49363 [Saccharata proteae CBS 121410]
MPDYDVLPEPFPARTATASGTVDGVQTEVTSISFADKIMVTITQGGRLAHWIHVPLPDATQHTAQPSHFANDLDDDLPDSELLPMAHLTATTVLGGTVEERNTVGQLLATQIASAVLMKTPEERRMVVVGLGLEGKELGREGFGEVVGLVLEVL